MLKDSIPGFFEILGGQSVNFSFRNDLESNPGGLIKFQLNKLEAGG